MIRAGFTARIAHEGDRLDVAGCSLAEVRKRLAAGLSELEERELLRALRADPRRAGLVQARPKPLAV